MDISALGAKQADSILAGQETQIREVFSTPSKTTTPNRNEIPGDAWMDKLRTIVDDLAKAISDKEYEKAERLSFYLQGYLDSHV